MSLWFRRAFTPGCLAALLGLLAAQPVPVPAAAPPPVARDGHGDPLPPHALARLGTVRLRTPDTFCSLAWSPDGRYLAASDYYGTARVWDARTGRSVPLPGGEYSGYAVCFSADWSVLVTAGKALQVFRCDDLTVPPVRSFDLSFDFRFIPRYLAVSPDGQMAATTGSLGNPAVYDLASGKALWASDAHKTGPAGRVAFSPDGKLLASADGGHPNALHLWDARTGRPAGRLQGHTWFPTSLGFSPRGDTLISSGSDGIRFWDVSTCKQTRHLPDSGDLALSPDGRLLARYRRDESTVWLHDPDTGKLLRTLDCGSAVWAGSATFSPDSKTLATGHYRSVRLWDVATGKEIRPRAGHHDAALSVRFSPDGRTVASRGADQAVRLWDRATGRERLALPLGNSARHLEVEDPVPSGSLAFAPDGRTLAALEGADNYTWGC
jgi:WD40 repeat protein